MAGGFNAFKLKVMEIQGNQKGGGGEGGGVNIQMLSKLLCEKRTKLEVGILRLAPTWKMTNDDVQS